MNGLANAAGQGGAGRIAGGYERLELRPRQVADATGYVQVKERANDIIGTNHVRFSQDPSRVEGQRRRVERPNT